MPKSVEIDQIEGWVRRAGTC